MPIDVRQSRNPLLTYFALETDSGSIRDKPIVELIAVFIEISSTFDAFVIWHVI